MPRGLKRYYGQDHVHYITCSCYHRQPWLATPQRRDLFSQILEEARQGYGFVLVGYVVMGAGPHIALESACTTTTEAAPLVAVFDEWVPQTRPVCAVILACGSVTLDLSGELIGRSCAHAVPLFGGFVDQNWSRLAHGVAG